MTPPDRLPPAENDPPSEAPPQVLPLTRREPAYHWYHKMWTFVFITFCLEIGLFLLIFPWTDYWGANYFSNLLPHMEQWWDNMYVRGAVSGLGVADLYISIVEIIRVRPFRR